MLIENLEINLELEKEAHLVQLKQAAILDQVENTLKASPKTAGKIKKVAKKEKKQD